LKADPGDCPEAFLSTRSFARELISNFLPL
jgi:hypothetical protein